MVYIFIMLIMQLISTINLITKNLNLPVHLFQLNWYTLLGTYMYSHAVHISYTCTNKVLNWSTLNDNILAVGIILLEWAWELYTRPNHHYDIKLLKGDLRKEPWVVIDKISKKVYFDLKSRCKEIKDHNFLPFLQLYDFA